MEPTTTATQPASQATIEMLTPVSVEEMPVHKAELLGLVAVVYALSLALVYMWWRDGRLRARYRESLARLGVRFPSRAFRFPKVVARTPYKVWK